VIASKNRGKVDEIRKVIATPGFSIQSLADYAKAPDVVEDGNTYRENALKKAKAYSLFTGETVLADDSGLEVDHLKGEPGIYSSRYAGSDATDEENYLKLLQALEGVALKDRGAMFRCVLVLYHPDGRFESFEGTWRGIINTEPVGEKGFGYDPIFYLPEMGLTVAQLAPEIKNKLSHRGQALDLFKQWLQKH
jgi:XTP/dITP diphosphohydrolase